MAAVQANGIRIEVERHGPEDGIPLLLVRGLGSQLIHWPPALIEGFTANGFHVVTYDNRDAGLSQKFGEHGVPDLDTMEARQAAGEAVSAPYSLADMAADGIGVLDALGLPAAHVLGISMGGMIVQHMALDHPARLLSATIVMSSSGAPDLPRATAEAEALLLAEPEDPSDREAVIAHTLRGDRVWGSPGFPFDEARRRALIGRAFDRCHYPEGIARQYAAVIANRGHVHGRLGEVRVPTLVIHGTDDTLLPIEHGRDLAARIPGASLVEIAGMGHDLEGGISAVIVEAKTCHARAASSRSAAVATAGALPDGP